MPAEAVAGEAAEEEAAVLARVGAAAGFRRPLLGPLRLHVLPQRRGRRLGPVRPLRDRAPALSRLDQAALRLARRGLASAHPALARRVRVLARALQAAPARRTAS